MKNLFGEEDFDPQEEWKDMPEFIQDHKKTIKQVLINFQKPEHIKIFNQITGLRIPSDNFHEPKKAEYGYFFVPDKPRLAYIDEEKN